MLENKFYTDVLKKVLLIALTLMLCRVTYGICGWILMLMGIVFALRLEYDKLAYCYLMFSLIAVFNPVLSGMTLQLGLAARAGNLVMSFFLLIAGAMNRKRREYLPIHWIFAYMLVAAVSSIDGWFPMISYLKLAQFFGFILGIMLISMVMQESDKGLYGLRCTIMAIAIIMIVGSLVVKFIPTIGYSMTFSRMAKYGINLQVQDLFVGDNTQLFNGMTMHSQMLAPIVSILATWVLCDMLLIEKKVSLLHVLLLSISPVLLYLSRSRGGFLTLVVTIGLTVFVCVPRARLSSRIRHHLVNVMVIGVLVMISIGVYFQLKEDTISRWLRKTEDVAGDQRTFTEAVTSSRMALVQENMHDFYLNPLFGKGFQVMPWLKEAYGNGFITWYSAPIEKGVTPVVILGETGLLGAFVFLVFLVSFYSACLRRKYFALMNMFTCTLIANLADSTLFSPAGLGGFLWVMSCVGGFGIDIMSNRINDLRDWQMSVYGKQIGAVWN